MYRYFIAAGFSLKKGLNKDEEVTKHKSETLAYNKWKQDLKELRDITTKLRESYKKSKGEFAIGNYF